LDVALLEQQLRYEALLTKAICDRILIERAASMDAIPLAAKAYNVEFIVLPEVAAMTASEDLNVPMEEASADFAAIADGLPQPINLKDVAAAYALYRREKKQTRAEAVKSIRSDLWLRSALGSRSHPGEAENKGIAYVQRGKSDHFEPAPTFKVLDLQASRGVNGYGFGCHPRTRGEVGQGRARRRCHDSEFLR
jgi:hypothetical protein